MFQPTRYLVTFLVDVLRVLVHITNSRVPGSSTRMYLWAISCPAHLDMLDSSYIFHVPIFRVPPYIYNQVRTSTWYCTSTRVDIGPNPRTFRIVLRTNICADL